MLQSKQDNVLRGWISILKIKVWLLDTAWTHHYKMFLELNEFIEKQKMTGQTCL